MAKTKKPARAKNVKKAAAKKPAARKAPAKASKPAVRKPAPKGPAKRASEPAKKKPVRKAAKPAAKPLRRQTAKAAVRKAKKIVKHAIKKPSAKRKPALAPKTAPGKPVAKKEAAARPAAPKPRPKAPNVQYAYGTYDGVLVCEKPGPFPQASPYTKSELQEVRDLLIQERDRLREVLRDLDQMTLRFSRDSGESAVPGYSIHLAEDASDSTDMDTALLLRRDEENALVQVEAAVERLGDPMFGVCVGCGEKIGMNRLRVKPDAHLCMKCRQAYDKNSRRY